VWIRADSFFGALRRATDRIRLRKAFGATGFMGPIRLIGPTLSLTYDLVRQSLFSPPYRLPPEPEPLIRPSPVIFFLLFLRLLPPPSLWRDKFLRLFVLHAHLLHHA
jgi:hypothetical protein